jgi:hypothetical protein
MNTIVNQIRGETDRNGAIRQNGVGRFEAILVWVCLGLVIVCAVVVGVLLVQIRGLTTDMAQMGHEFTVAKAKLNQFEKVARQIVDSEAKTQPRQPPLVLGTADIQIIRQFIKVAPPKPGARPKISVGDDLSGLAAGPIPDSLADALPKLRGARFSSDQDGAIIIIGAGSNRVDALIAHR